MGATQEPSQREAIQAEVARILESAVFSAQGQFEAAKVWRALHWTLGVLAAALSTLAAVLTFVTDAQVVSGTLAVVAAIAAAVLTSCRPDKLAERAVSRGNDYTTLRNDARRVLHLQVSSDEVCVLREALEGLAGRASDLDHTSDPIPRFAYNRAKRNIERDGGQQFEVDAL